MDGKDLRREARDLKEVVAEQTLELRLLKKSMIGDGGAQEIHWCIYEFWAAIS